MREVCYIQDPKTGRFLGSKPGCSHGSGELSEKLLEKVEKDKAAIKRRVDAAAAGGKLQHQDSAAKDKAVELAHAVNNGKMSNAEALYDLSRGSRASGRYAKAIELIDRDAAYWKGISGKVGSDEVDTLIGSYAGAPVPGVTDFALSLAGGKATVQEVSDEEPLGLPSGKNRKQVDKELQDRLDNIKKRAVNFNSLNKDGSLDKANFTKYVGSNTMKTKATFYYLPNKHTSNGAIYDEYAFTGAMQPIDVGVLHGGKCEYSRVTNLDDPNKSVILKINDCGPYTHV